ncbi:MAG TPA: beta-phosphoglucomutase [Firmicutes bacterium]|nr:beta-phosphoglucomutase [Bacillota bacterium]
MVGHHDGTQKEAGQDGRKIRAFIFDLDGVLTDTAEYHYRAWKRLADEEKVPFTREDNEKLRGVSRRASLELIFHGRSLTEEKASELMDRKNGYYREYLQNITAGDLLPGAIELLGILKARGCRLALASASKNAPGVIERLNIASYFEVIADGNSVQKTKPAPDLFLYAADRLGIPPENCLVVEDAEAGIAAARAAGMATIGIGPPERVGKADYIYPSVAAIRLEDIRGIDC